VKRDFCWSVFVGVQDHKFCLDISKELGNLRKTVPVLRSKIPATTIFKNCRVDKKVLVRLCTHLSSE
jgi:hypothetical protein